MSKKSIKRIVKLVKEERLIDDRKIERQAIFFGSLLGLMWWSFFVVLCMSLLDLSLLGSLGLGASIYVLNSLLRTNPQG